MDLWHFVDEMRLALYQCGQIALGLQGQVRLEEKIPDSAYQQSVAVSVTDRLCQEIIFLRAWELAPEIEVYSEEMAACPKKVRALFEKNRHRYVLIVDPVDGTDDYLAGKETFAHMVGLLDQQEGTMVCGMIYFPFSQELYWGIRGMGAFSARGFWGVPCPMRPQVPSKTVGEIKRLTSQDYEAFQSLGFKVVSQQSRSTAYELMRVARGELGALVMRQFHGHDTGIAGMIIRELGGVEIGIDGQPIVYEKGMPRLPLVVLTLCPDYGEELSRVLCAK